MGLKNWIKNRRMSDPVQAVLQLTACSAGSSGAAYSHCRMQGVVTGAEVGPVAVEHYCTAPTSRWPQPGQGLPVMVDRADPTRLRVLWKQIPTNRDRARQITEALAQQQARADRHDFSSAPAEGSAPPGMEGVAAQVQSLLGQITAAARTGGATVTGSSIVYEVVGAPGRPMPGTPGGGLTPDQAAAAAGLQEATARVLAVHEITPPPEPGGGGPGGVVDITLDVSPATGSGYATTTRIAFSSPEKRARIAIVGRSLPVLINPGARDQIAIDTRRLD